MMSTILNVLINEGMNAYNMFGYNSVCEDYIIILCNTRDDSDEGVDEGSKYWEKVKNDKKKDLKNNSIKNEDYLCGGGIMLGRLRPVNGLFGFKKVKKESSEIFKIIKPGDSDGKTHYMTKNDIVQNSRYIYEAMNSHIKIFKKHKVSVVDLNLLKICSETLNGLSKSYGSWYFKNLDREEKILVIKHDVTWVAVYGNILVNYLDKILDDDEIRKSTDYKRLLSSYTKINKSREDLVQFTGYVHEYPKSEFEKDLERIRLTNRELHEFILKWTDIKSQHIAKRPNIR